VTTTDRVRSSGASIDQFGGFLPVQALASGKFDALAGRYLHAELNSPDVLRGRIEEIQASDLNVIRLRR
jgi:hypothetical protein